MCGPCVRKVLPTVDSFDVVQYEEHNHHEKAQGTRAFLKPEEKVLADKFYQLGLPPIKFQMAMESFAQKFLPSGSTSSSTMSTNNNSGDDTRTANLDQRLLFP